MCETAHQKKGISVNLDGAFPACGGSLPSVIAFGVRSAPPPAGPNPSGRRSLTRKAAERVPYKTPLPFFFEIYDLLLKSVFFVTL